MDPSLNTYISALILIPRPAIEIPTTAKAAKALKAKNLLKLKKLIKA